MFVIVVFFFIFALASLIAITGWNVSEEAFSHVLNETGHNDTVMLERFNVLDNWFTWPDKIFVMMYVGMLILFLISAVTLPSENPIFLLAFIGMLILTTVISMMFSNAWTAILQTDDLLETASEDLTFTDHFMTFFPIYTFFIGILGALIFYAKKQDTFTGGGGSIDGFE